MRNCMFKVLVAGVFGLLVGCQSNPGKPASLFGAPFANPSFAPSSQGNLTQSVQEALMRNDELAVAPIRVETRQNVVILSGYVKKIRQSDTAELIARQVPGVQSVENRIIVRP
ncbi:BON domain-containing protein [Legionella lytica]|uniref:BON domain-containing protein n=1 Tax=Legionella lytica TaxID=96232 RepID=A0ABY4YB53_9GAMM|nr:BON domain-containing protein [Legionella lytica]USQ14883.1 BON domain-containing protein [Legionella lytica]